MSAGVGKTRFPAVWLILAGGYVATSLLLPAGRPLTEFSDAALCIILLFANAGLLMNAATPDWRRNAFWMLLGLGCALSLAGQLLLTYFEVVRRQGAPDPFLGDVVFFLHSVPWLGALALRPHSAKEDHNLRFGRVDFQLLLSWWVFVYLFVVTPWQYVAQNTNRYHLNFNTLYGLENFMFAVALAILAVRTKGPWRKVYGHLAGAATAYAATTMCINAEFGCDFHETGRWGGIALAASFVWFGVAGIIARHVCPRAEGLPVKRESAALEIPEENNWPARMSVAAVISLPMLILWSELLSDAPASVKRFRLFVTLGATCVLTSLVFLRQRLVDEDRLRLLLDAQNAYSKLKQVRNQFVESEKLAALGQLVAGAAHEINNPLTAILGYSDVLADDPATAERARGMARKIREQALRTKDVVGKLLTFAQPQAAERTLLDVNSIIASVVELRRFDLKQRNIHIELESEARLPGVRGDTSQILQVFFNIISNAVTAMEESGGTLTIRTMRDRSNAVIEFSDTGCGIREPHKVFDPFYSTTEVGKGTGLGLSICYSLVREHKGRIMCFNRPEGGATFRVELPAVMAFLPTTFEASPAASFSASASSSSSSSPPSSRDSS